MAAAPVVGAILGHYQIIARIGHGGMGLVYLARDTTLDREVALKFLPPGLVTDDSKRNHFKAEAQLLARLNHPNIGTIYGFESISGVDFLVMEYIRGTTLAELITSSSIPQERVTAFGLQLASALEEAHGRNVIHRDLKPANIVVTPDGRAKVLDFGIAQLLPSPDGATMDFSAAGFTSAGTPGYMAPEQLRGTGPDARSDIYSLGVVLYEMATGQSPYSKANLADLVESVLHRDPAPPSELNSKLALELERIICKAMDRNPALRYQTATEVRVDLQRLISPVTPFVPPRREKHRQWGIVAACAILFVLAVGAVLQFKRGIPTVLPERKILAVLPFEPIGGGPDNEALCRGLTELITVRLAQIGKQYNIEVIPAGEVRAHGVKTSLDARKKLGVTLVVEGSWDMVGQNHVMYSLVDARNARTLNAQVVRATVADVSSLEEEVAGQLLTMMEPQVQLSAEPTPKMPANRRAAYQEYVRGRGYLMDYQNPQSLASARALFQSAISLDSNFALARAGLAEALWRQYEERKDTALVTDALKQANQAKQLDDRLAPVHVTFGLILGGTGKHQEAVAEFEEALTLDSTSDAAYRGLAASYSALNRIGEAEKTYLRAIAARPDYWGGYSALGVFYNNIGRYEDAAKQFQKVIDLAPENPRGYTSLGGVFYLQGRYEEAQRSLQQSLAIQPNYRAYNNLATLYFFQGRYSDAASMAEKALSLDDRDYRVWRGLAASYYWAPGQRAQATAAYEKAANLIEAQRKVNPHDSKLTMALADCYSMLGRKREAESLVQQAMTDAPADVENNFRAAEVYEQLGQREAALRWLEKAVRAGYAVAEVKGDPTLEQLRADPRYAAIARQTGPKNTEAK